MPNQARQPEATYPEHAEQVKQCKEDKGDLVFATGANWNGDTATDDIYMAAESDSWFDAVLLR